MHCPQTAKCEHGMMIMEHCSAKQTLHRMLLDICVFSSTILLRSIGLLMLLSMTKDAPLSCFIKVVEQCPFADSFPSSKKSTALHNSSSFDCVRTLSMKVSPLHCRTCPQNGNISACSSQISVRVPRDGISLNSENT